MTNVDRNRVFGDWRTMMGRFASTGNGPPVFGENGHRRFACTRVYVYKQPRGSLKGAVSEWLKGPHWKTKQRF